ncbi:MAG TPA: hypothetical protein DEB31_10210 [Clostridiales bacterium]|nr:hypothetical protein [Clostridiales bacterium]
MATDTISQAAITPPEKNEDTTTSVMELSDELFGQLQETESDIPSTVVAAVGEILQWMVQAVNPGYVFPEEMGLTLRAILTAGVYIGEGLKGVEALGGAWGDAAFEIQWVLDGISNEAKTLGDANLQIIKDILSANGGILKDIWDSIKSAGPEIGEIVQSAGSGIWNGIKDIGTGFQNMWTFVLSPALGSFVTALGGIGTTIGAALCTAGNAILSFVLTAVETLATALGLSLTATVVLIAIGILIIASVLYLVENARRSNAFDVLAQGGFPEKGRPFIAREAGPELVGTISGRNAVVNNDQIIESVSRGVYGAFKSALKSNNTKTTAIARVYLDGKQIAMA